eukprot:7413926-Prorocentrum_lima.AAC.1
MTSSLVGSEMCIRDRPYLQSHIYARTALADQEPTRAYAGRDRKCGARAVSYTHLTLPTICSV